MENADKKQCVVIRVWSNTRKNAADPGCVIWSYPMTAYPAAIEAMYGYAHRMFPPSYFGFWYRFEIIDQAGCVICQEFQPAAGDKCHAGVMM